MAGTSLAGEGERLGHPWDRHGLPPPCRNRRLRGLLVDFGGVLTTNVFASFEAFCRAEGLDPDHVKQLFRTDERARQLLVDLETGALPEPEFEAAFGERLGLPPEDLIARLFAGMAPDEAMIGAVRAARDHGIVTGLLSNSWGMATDYDGVGDIFDAQVISAAEGMRKPDPRIYPLAAERMGLPPEEIVFVDDLGFNLKPAKELGMTTVLHKAAKSTIEELESLLRVPLSSAG
jgi:epoxide hydrolase-like predicted phosphatase